MFPGVVSVHKSNAILKADAHSRHKHDLRHDFTAAARFCGAPIHAGKYTARGGIASGIVAPELKLQRSAEK